MSRGKYITAEVELRIVKLLKDTEMSMAVIAERFGLTRSAIRVVNDRNKVRIYNKEGKSWRLIT